MIPLFGKPLLDEEDFEEETFRMFRQMEKRSFYRTEDCPRTINQ